MEIQMGGGVFELGNPEWRGAQAVLEIQVDGGGGGQKTVPSVVGVWIFSGITQCMPNKQKGCVYTLVLFHMHLSIFLVRIGSDHNFPHFYFF